MWLRFRLYNKVCLVWKKFWQLQLQVSNICHVNNIFRTCCLSPKCSVNLAETSHTHRFFAINACLKNLIV